MIQIYFCSIKTLIQFLIVRMWNLQISQRGLSQTHCLWMLIKLNDCYFILASTTESKLERLYHCQKHAARVRIYIYVCVCVCVCVCACACVYVLFPSTIEASPD